MPVIVERPAADEIAVHHARFVDIDAAADFEVELTLGHRGHAPALDAAGAGGDFHAVTDAADGHVPFEVIARDADQVGMVADVFGARPPLKKMPRYSSGLMSWKAMAASMV